MGVQNWGHRGRGGGRREENANALFHTATNPVSLSPCCNPSTPWCPNAPPAPTAPSPAPVADPADLPAALTFQPDDGLCPAQRAFLARKARYAVGGAFMPPSSVCAVCDGAGKHVCHRCGGTCVNPPGAAEAMGLDPDGELHSFNGRVDIRMYLMEGGAVFFVPGDRHLRLLPV